MGCITVALDGVHLATIDMAGLDGVDVHAHGALDVAQKATLCVMGGNYADDGCGHLIWIPERDLQPGEILEVRLNERCEIADRGRTIAELYAHEAPSSNIDYSISDDMAAEIRARPRKHDEFLVRVTTSLAQQAIAASDELNTDYAFSVTWTRFRPDQALVRLATYCLDDVLARTGGTEQLRTGLTFGDSVCFSVLR